MQPDLRQVMGNHVLEVVTHFNRAVEAVILEFARRNGIEIPPVEENLLAYKQKLVNLIGVVQVQYNPLQLKGNDQTLLMAWCVDRRDGKDSVEQTWPLARVKFVEVEGQMAYKVEIVDEPEKKEQSNG